VKKRKMTQTKLAWNSLGPITANMTLSHIPKRAGLYKLDFKLWDNTYTYIGEAGARGLRARIADYANYPPREGKVEHLLHDLLTEADEVELSVWCTGLTLDEQKSRRKFEKDAVAATHEERSMCLNKGGYLVDVPMQRFILKTEEKMLLEELERVRAKLAKLD
jgi:hypothetical protein